MEGVWYVDGLEHIHARVFSIVASCLRGVLVIVVDSSAVVAVSVLRVVAGESAANPRKAWVFLMDIGFRSVLMKRRSMTKLKRPMWMMWSMTFSCSRMVGAQVILVRSDGKERRRS